MSNEKLMLTLNGKFIRNVFLEEVEGNRIVFKSSDYLELIDVPYQINIQGINNVYLSSCNRDSNNDYYICEGICD